MSDFIFLVQLPVWQSASQPGEEMRNECWIVGCQIKTPGLLRLPCTAGLRWVLSSVSNHIKVFILFSIPIQQVQRQGDRSAGLSWGWFLFVDHDLEIQIKSHFWSEISAVMQLTISTNHKICLLLNWLNFISIDNWRIFSVGKSFVFWDFYERFKKLKGNPRLVLG